MFYLLKDNRIIDSNNIRNENDVCVKEDQYQKVYELQINCSSIKKQSENVIDLIEIGDIIKYKFYNGCHQRLIGVDIVTDLDFRTDGIDYIGLSHEYIEKNNSYDSRRGMIVGIYKPNSKGDYIKVWGI